jgi:hypothetical protein
MNPTNSRKVVLALGGILVATLAAGCFGGGRGYSNPYGYNSSYSSYGDSYPYSGYDRGYSYPQTYGNSYSAGYQNGVRADENRDRRQYRDADQHPVVIRDRNEARTQTTVDNDRYSRKDSVSGRHTEQN